MQVTTTVTYATGIWTVIGAGGAGGFIAALYAMVDGGKDQEGRWVVLRGANTPIFLVARTLIGVGGAMAVMLAAISIKQFTTGSDLDDLALTGLCVVAGSIGHRLLPIVAAQLEKKIGEFEQKMGQLEAQTDAAHEKADAEAATRAMVREVDTAVQLFTAEPRSLVLISRQTQTLGQLLPKFPTDRRLHLVLARLYAKVLDDREDAVKVLTAYIANKGIEDADVADAWFNIACYHALPGASRKPAWAQNAVTALSKSLAINPENAEDAAKDPDLADLRTQPVYEELVKPFPKAKPAS